MNLTPKALSTPLIPIEFWGVVYSGNPYLHEITQLSNSKLLNTLKNPHSPRGKTCPGNCGRKNRGTKYKGC